jgi:DNA-directed RNA polymerase sigma subunit (sigma70/sigma32)
MYYFTAIERFDPGNGERWVGYTRWLGRADLTRVVTLDSLLCPPVVHGQSSRIFRAERLVKSSWPDYCLECR